MKKIRIFCLSLLVLLSGLIFSACSDGVFAKTIYLNDYNTSSSVIEIETSKVITTTVAMTPSNLTNREFSATVLDKDKKDYLSFECNSKAMTLKIIATSDIGDAKTVNLSIKIKAKKSDASTVVKVKIVAPESPEMNALPKPELSLDANGNLSWTKVENSTGYVLQICEGETVLKTETIKNALNYALDINSYAGKSITAKIKAKARTSDLDSEYAIIYFDVLSAPHNLSFDLDTHCVVWDAVENANGYNVKLGTKIIHVSENNFNASGYFDTVGSKTISVMAVGGTNNRYFSSTYTAPMTVSKLSSVSGFALSGDVLSWSQVDGAINYNLKIKNGQDVLNFDVQNNYVDLSTKNLEAGNYTVSVSPIGQNANHIHTISGDAKDFAFEKLGKVTGLKLENGKLKWNSTAPAYRIYIDGQIYRETRTASFDYSIISSQMITDLNIVAVGDNATKISSGLLDDIMIYKLSVPELSFDGVGNVLWNPVANASGYQATIDNDLKVLAGKDETSLSILNDAVDYSSAKIISFMVKGDADGEVNDSVIYLDSDSTYRTIAKLAPVNLQFAKSNGEDCVVWSGANAGGYQIFATDGHHEYQSERIYQNSLAISNFVIEEDLLAEKTYQIYAKTLATLTSEIDWYLPSENSAALTITKLPNISLQMNNGVIVWNYPYADNTLGYQATLTANSQTIDLPKMLSNQTSFDLTDQASDEYIFSIYAIGDTAKKYISSSPSSITTIKLNEIQSVSVEKTTTASFYSPLDKYTISFVDTNNGHANYVCRVNNIVTDLSKSGNNYSFDIFSSQISGEINVQIAINGDSTLYANCKAFGFSISKIDEPIVTTNSDGTAIETNALKYLVLLKVDGQDNANTQTGTKSDLIYLETDKQFKIKAIAFEDEQIVRNDGRLQIDSSFSDVYRVDKLPTPRLYVNTGTLMVESTGGGSTASYYFNYDVNGAKATTEAKNFANMNTLIADNNDECTISGYFTDKNSGVLNNGVIYLRSDVCQSIRVKKLPKPSSVYMRDGVIYVTFVEGQTIFGGKLAIYVNNEDVTSDNNTQTSYEFASHYTEAGKYTISAKAISIMSGAETSVVYSLHGDESEKIQVEKLGQVEEISVTAFVPEENGTVANMVSSINSAMYELPNRMPYQSGFVRFKAVTSAVRYMISNDSGTKKIYVDNASNGDGYIYVNFQGTDFGSGSNTIYVTAIGNQKEIIDGEESDEFTFTKLIAPTNVRVENGKIVWNEPNNPNNSGLSNGNLLGTNYPKWMFSENNNAFIYYALVNGKYVCTLDFSSMTNLDLDGLCKMTNSLKDLSYDANLETTATNVYTIQICSSALNSHIQGNEFDLIMAAINGTDMMTFNTKRTKKIYVNSDFSNSILVRPITSPYGLTMDNGMLKWLTPYSISNSAETIALNNAGFEVSGYQVRVYKNGEVQYFGEDENQKDYTLVSGASNTQWNFADYLQIFLVTEGNYSFEVKTVVRQTGSSPEVYYVNSAYSLSFTTTALQVPALGLKDGRIAWQIVNGNPGYAITIDGIRYTTYENEDLFKYEDEIYTFVGSLADGEHVVNIQAIGGDEKTLISSPPSANVVYTKLKKVSLYVDENSGLIKFLENGQYKLDSTMWSYFVNVDGFDDVDNSHLTIFDMSYRGNEYEGGQVYSVKVVAKNKDKNFVVASSSASDMIIDSDISDTLMVYKIKAPSEFDIVDNYQSVSWSNRDTNVNNLKYIITIANNTISTGLATKYNFEGSGEVNAVVSVSAIYSGVITIDGQSYYCVRSDANEYVNVHKLSTPKDIKFDDGVMSWYRSLDSETHLIIKDTNEIVDRDSYDFAEEAPGLYQVYLYNLVPEDKRTRTATDIYLSSENTETYKVEKLSTPTGFEIEQTYDITNALTPIYNFSFDSVANSTRYQMAVKGLEDNVLYSDNNLSAASLQFMYYMFAGEAFEDLNSYDFRIYIKAIGSTIPKEEVNTYNTYYVNSNTNYLFVERIDGTEEIVKQTDDILSNTGTLVDTFTGRFDWIEVDDANNYYALIEYLDEVDANDYVFVNNGTEIFRAGNKKIYQFDYDKTYCQFAHAGNYSIKIITVPEIVPAKRHNSLDIESYFEKTIQSANVVFDGDISYLLFSSGEGTELNPYVVSTFEQFTCIKYNIYAHYKLNADIDYTNAMLYNRSFNTIPEFYGTIDGNDKKLTIAYAENFAGIVETLCDGAIISNLTIAGTITSLKSIENEVVVGAFASYNYGTIEKCLNTLDSISAPELKFSILGGISAINYGVISKSGNIGNLYGNIVGGIAAKMLGVSISECYNGTDGTTTIKAKTAELKKALDNIQTGASCGFAGGIVAYLETGEIVSCYDYASIIVDNSTTGIAYVGGIAAYVTGNATIKNSYAIDNYIKNVGKLIRAIQSGARANVGILIGKISSLSESLDIQDCAVVSQNASGTATTSQILFDAIGGGYAGNDATGYSITGIIKNGTTEYQYIYNVVSRNNDGIYVNYTNKYCTLANAKYDD